VRRYVVLRSRVLLATPTARPASGARDAAPPSPEGVHLGCSFQHLADIGRRPPLTRSGHGGIDYSISLRACVQRRRERGFAHQGREASYLAAMYSRASPVAYALRRRCISRIESSAIRRSSAVRMYLRMAPSVSPASSCSTSSCTR